MSKVIAISLISFNCLQKQDTGSKILFLELIYLNEELAGSFIQIVYFLVNLVYCCLQKSSRRGLKENKNSYNHSQCPVLNTNIEIIKIMNRHITQRTNCKTSETPFYKKKLSLSLIIILSAHTFIILPTCTELDYCCCFQDL